jgi:hypothetical protein
MGPLAHVTAENGIASATFKSLDGSEFAVRIPLQSLPHIRAFTSPEGHIGFTRFGTFRGLDSTLAGEANHEVVHAYIKRSLIPTDDLTRFSSHADQSRILDVELRDYLEATPLTRTQIPC